MQSIGFISNSNAVLRNCLIGDPDLGDAVLVNKIFETIRVQLSVKIDMNKATPSELRERVELLPQVEERIQRLAQSIQQHGNALARNEVQDSFANVYQHLKIHAAHCMKSFHSRKNMALTVGEILHLDEAQCKQQLTKFIDFCCLQRERKSVGEALLYAFRMHKKSIDWEALPQNVLDVVEDYVKSQLTAFLGTVYSEVNKKIQAPASLDAVRKALMAEFDELAMNKEYKKTRALLEKMVCDPHLKICLLRSLWGLRPVPAKNEYLDGLVQASKVELMNSLLASKWELFLFIVQGQRDFAELLLDSAFFKQSELSEILFWLQDVGFFRSQEGVRLASLLFASIHMHSGFINRCKVHRLEIDSLIVTPALFLQCAKYGWKPTPQVIDQLTSCISSADTDIDLFEVATLLLRRVMIEAEEDLLPSLCTFLLESEMYLCIEQLLLLGYALPESAIDQMIDRMVKAEEESQIKLASLFLKAVTNQIPFYAARFVNGTPVVQWAYLLSAESQQSHSMSVIQNEEHLPMELTETESQAMQLIDNEDDVIEVMEEGSLLTPNERLAEAVKRKISIDELLNAMKVATEFPSLSLIEERALMVWVAEQIFSNGSTNDLKVFAVNRLKMQPHNCFAQLFEILGMVPILFWTSTINLWLPEELFIESQGSIPFHGVKSRYETLGTSVGFAGFAAPSVCMMLAQPQLYGLVSTDPALLTCIKAAMNSREWREGSSLMRLHLVLYSISRIDQRSMQQSLLRILFENGNAQEVKKRSYALNLLTWQYNERLPEECKSMGEADKMIWDFFIDKLQLTINERDSLFSIIYGWENPYLLPMLENSYTALDTLEGDYAIRCLKEIVQIVTKENLSVRYETKNNLHLRLIDHFRPDLIKEWAREIAWDFSDYLKMHIWTPPPAVRLDEWITALMVSSPEFCQPHFLRLHELIHTPHEKKPEKEKVLKGVINMLLKTSKDKHSRALLNMENRLLGLLAQSRQLCAQDREQLFQLQRLTEILAPTSLLNIELEKMVTLFSRTTRASRYAGWKILFTGAPEPMLRSGYDFNTCQTPENAKRELLGLMGAVANGENKMVAIVSPNGIIKARRLVRLGVSRSGIPYLVPESLYPEENVRLEYQQAIDELIEQLCGRMGLDLGIPEGQAQVVTDEELSHKEEVIFFGGGPSHASYYDSLSGLRIGPLAMTCIIPRRRGKKI